MLADKQQEKWKADLSAAALAKAEVEWLKKGIENLKK